MDPIRFLETKDPMQRMAMQLVAHEAAELHRQFALEHAQVQAEYIGKLFGGK